ncbi:DUF1640 domain-containing protein [Nitrosomonas communis]|uniref:DUF1640 domain-containing protein n=1 Tax=Nitrosomonas communis TaxID=44574 RepID=A0A1H2QCE4_9PROT|nr:DUF1640 domain-containing protein [Nitrosomonas communis]SDW04089.1 Protein of unknown function [Nitrosomonas communis]
MPSISFDTHKFIRRLREAGISEKHAEAIAEAFREANLEAEIATKTDLRELEYRLIIKLGTMIVVAIGVVATLVKLL